MCKSAVQLQGENGLALSSCRFQLMVLRSVTITAGHRRQREHKGYGHKKINCFGELVKESGEFCIFLSFHLKSCVT